MVLINEDNIEIILFYGQANRSYHVAAKLFSQMNPFLLVKNATRSGHPSVKIEELQIEVLATIAVQLKQSVHIIAAAVGTSKSTVHGILKKHIFRFLKIHLG